MKKVILLLLAVLLISTVFVGCDHNTSKVKHISLNPDIINMKVGETIWVTAKMTNAKGKSVSVDDSEFKWSIVTGEDAISIVPNGNAVKIKAKKVIGGGAIIRVTHPDAEYRIERVVHITTIQEEEKGDIFFRIIPSATFEPSPFYHSIKERDSLKLCVEIKKAASDPSLKVDNSKFEWTIIKGEDFIEIKPDKNIIKITAIGKGGFIMPIIKVTHPYAKQAGQFELGIEP